MYITLNIVAVDSDIMESKIMVIGEVIQPPGVLLYITIIIIITVYRVYFES